MTRKPAALQLGARLRVGAQARGELLAQRPDEVRRQPLTELGLLRREDDRLLASRRVSSSGLYWPSVSTMRVGFVGHLAEDLVAAEDDRHALVERHVQRSILGDDRVAHQVV